MDDKKILEDCRKYLKEQIDNEEPERRKMKDDCSFARSTSGPQKFAGSGRIQTRKVVLGLVSRLTRLISTSCRS